MGTLRRPPRNADPVQLSIVRSAPSARGEVLVRTASASRIVTR